MDIVYNLDLSFALNHCLFRSLFTTICCHKQPANDHLNKIRFDDSKKGSHFNLALRF